MFNIRSGFLLAFTLLAATWLPAQSPSQADVATSGLQISNRNQYVGLPLAFEVNRGQAARGVDFVTRGQGYSAQLRADRVTLGLSQVVGDAPGRSKMATAEVIEINLAGANRHARAVGGDKLPGHSNYLFGSNPAAWITDVEQYTKVRYADVYPGIDLVFHGNQGRLEHDFVLHPGADARRIAFDFSGVQQSALSGSGDLLLGVGVGQVQLQKPRAYQIVGGREVEVSVHYSVTAGGTHLSVGNYDRRRTLIIDPVVVYSTFLGGFSGTANFSTQFASGLATDASGNLYVTGRTSASDFPVTSGALQTTLNQNTLAFVSKINPSGRALVYSTYISGLGPSFGNLLAQTGLAVDSSGNVFLGGQGGPGLPIPPGSHPFQPNERGIAVLKLNGAGNGVIFATYLGGSGPDSVGGLAIDSAGDVYLTGTTLSNDFPLQNPLQATLGSTSNAFVTEFNPTGTGLVYSTYLGATSTADGFGITVDALGNAYVVGQAGAGFPTVNAEQPTCIAGYQCPFAAKFSAGGTALLYSTFLGTGSGPYVAGLAVAVDSSGGAYVTGSAGTEAFVTKLDNTGALKYSTLLDSSLSTNAGVAIGLDLSNNAYIVSTNGFVSETNSAGSVVSSIYLPGTDDYSNGFNADPSGPQALAVDASGNIYVAGVAYAPYSVSDQFLGVPVFNALQPNFVGTTGARSVSTDAFIIKISPSPGAAAAVAPSSIQFPGIQQVGTTSIGEGMVLYDLGSDPLTISNVTTSGDFAVQVNDCPTTVAPWASCGIGVTFTPTATGTRNGNLIIADSSAGSPHTVALSGQGGQPTVAVMPTSLNFSSQAVGTTSAQQEVRINANGGINVQISRIDITGDFAETNIDCSLLNAQGQSPCEIFVTFTPTVTGPRSGTLTVTDSAINSPQVISLTGTGAPPGLGLAVAPGGSSSAKVAAGTTAMYSLSIGGAGMSGMASLSCTGAPPGATCTAPATEAVSATTATDFNVTVTTTSRSAAALRRSDFRGSPWLCAFALMGLVVLPPTEIARRRARRHLRLLPLLLLVFLCCCGGNSNGGSSSSGTPAGTYTLTVVATVGTASQRMQLTLTVQ